MADYITDSAFVTAQPRVAAPGVSKALQEQSCSQSPPLLASKTGSNRRDCSPGSEQLLRRLRVPKSPVRWSEERTDKGLQGSGDGAAGQRGTGKGLQGTEEQGRGCKAEGKGLQSRGEGAAKQRGTGKGLQSRGGKGCKAEGNREGTAKRRGRGSAFGPRAHPQPGPLLGPALLPFPPHAARPHSPHRQAPVGSRSLSPATPPPGRSPVPLPGTRGAVARRRFEAPVRAGVRQRFEAPVRAEPTTQLMSFTVVIRDSCTAKQHQTPLLLLLNNPTK